jgi:hypothetical protein
VFVFMEDAVEAVSSMDGKMRDLGGLGDGFG